MMDGSETEEEDDAEADAELGTEDDEDFPVVKFGSGGPMFLNKSSRFSFEFVFPIWGPREWNQTDREKQKTKKKYFFFHKSFVDLTAKHTSCLLSHLLTLWKFAHAFLPISCAHPRISAEFHFFSLFFFDSAFFNLQVFSVDWIPSLLLCNFGTVIH